MQNANITYSKKMHEVLIDKLLGAPINLFHDITPKGHIITRLGKDLDNSSGLNSILSAVVRVSFQLLGAVVICILFNIWTLPIILFMMLIHIYILKFFLV